jgi:hypothetical protein
MTIQLPLGPRSGTSTAAGTGVSVNLSASASGFLPKLQSDVLRAAAAAVAAADPGGGLEKAKLARDDLSKVVKPVPDRAEVQKVLVAIEAELEHPSGAKPDDVAAAAAAAAGANPRLVAAALTVVSTDTGARDNTLSWVAGLDGALLGRAALAASRQQSLDFIPDQLTRLEQVENTIGSLTTDVGSLKTDTGSLKTHVAGLTTQVGQIDKRVVVLEGNPSYKQGKP